MDSQVAPGRLCHEVKAPRGGLVTVIDNLRLYRGLKSSIEVLKLMQSGAELGETTPFDEGRPWRHLD